MNSSDDTYENLRLKVHLEQVYAENARLRASLQEIKDRDAQQEGYYWFRGGEINKLQEENKTLKEQSAKMADYYNNICGHHSRMVVEQYPLQKELREAQGTIAELQRRLEDANKKGSPQYVFALQKEITHLKNQWKGQCTLVDTLNEVLRKAETNVADLTRSRDDLRRNNQKLIMELDLIKRQRDEALESYTDLLDKYT